MTATATAAPASASASVVTLSNEQSAAIDAILAWLKLPRPAFGGNDTAPFFVLSGPAGTGKTTCIRELSSRLRGRLVFTAPTNKATRVLKRAVTLQDYTPDCRTIHSLLGLKMEANGEVKELAAPEDPIDLSKFLCVVVDEASMVNQQLLGYIQQAADDYGVRFLFLGDAAQLPPVKEARSPIWQFAEANGAALTKVLRHDNQILTLATRLRECVDHPAPRMQFDDDNAEGEGVFRLDSFRFSQAVHDAASSGYFFKPDYCKVIAWRNVVVDQWNGQIRKWLFDNDPLPRWLPEDRVIFTAPAKNLEDKIIATTDTEGKIDRTATGQHPTFPEYRVWFLNLTLDDGQGTVQAMVLHEQSEKAFQKELDRLRLEARTNGRVWKQFWSLYESVHYLRHGYAITAHRSQGSTYNTAYVCWQDILRNPNRPEALRCFYVACTRARKVLMLG